MIGKRAVLACGHVANGIYTSEEGAKYQCCLIDIRLHPVEAKQVVNLKGRIAHCRECGEPAKSDSDLPDFFYQKDKKTDIFYDGCRG